MWRLLPVVHCQHSEHHSDSGFLLYEGIGRESATRQGVPAVCYTEIDLTYPKINRLIKLAADALDGKSQLGQHGKSQLAAHF